MQDCDDLSKVALKQINNAQEFLHSSCRSKNEGKHDNVTVLILVGEYPYYFNSSYFCVESKSLLYRYDTLSVFGNLDVLCLLLCLCNFRNCGRITGQLSCFESINSQAFLEFLQNQETEVPCHALAQKRCNQQVWVTHGEGAVHRLHHLSPLVQQEYSWRAAKYFIWFPRL